MGHSFGGAFTQILLDRGLGAAGVAVDSAAVKGVMKLPFSTLRTGWPILRNPRNRHRAVADRRRSSSTIASRITSPSRSHARSSSDTACRRADACCSRELRRTSRRSRLRRSTSRTTTGAAAVHRRRHRPRQPAVDQQGQRQEVPQVAGADRVPRVRGSIAFHHRSARVGIGSGLRAELGSGARRRTGCE